MILIDQDGPLADFEKRLEEQVLEHSGGRWHIPRSKRIGWDASDDYERNLGSSARKLIQSIVRRPGFYKSLPPVEGAKNALTEMVAAGHDVWICTTANHKNPTCASDKVEWAGRHLGESWRRRVIITPDKTLINADMLIDDKPQVSGLLQPSWRQILFDTPYNKDFPTVARLQSWAEWPIS